MNIDPENIQSLVETHLPTPTYLPGSNLLEISGWWYTYPSEKIMEFVSWDDDIPNIYMET